MSHTIYRFRIGGKVPDADIEATLLLAIVAVECLHGEADVRLDAAHSFDRQRHICVIDASRPVGRDLSRLFAGLLRREFGHRSFRVETRERAAGRRQRVDDAGSRNSFR